MNKEIQNRTWISARYHSFGYAFRGIIYLFKTQPNAQIHAVAAVLVILLGFLFHISPLEWALIAISIGAVITTELINTAIESLTDLLSPEIQPKAGFVKDLAAGAVLVSAIAAGCIGCIIFVPKFFEWII